MLVDENEVLSIARRKLGLIFFHDFYHLKPPKSGKKNNYLNDVKSILLSRHYICHERQYKLTLDCDYQGDYTHFHKPGSGYKNSQNFVSKITTQP